MQVLKEKLCPACKKTKSVDEFGPRKASKDGLTWGCRECKKAYHRAYYLKHHDKYLAEGKARHHADRDGARDRHLKYTLGITGDDYKSLYEKQSGKCAICGVSKPLHGTPKNRALAVDHDHKTGVIRALLCDPCNKGLGHFGDDVDLMKKATEYLISYNLKIG